MQTPTPSPFSFEAICAAAGTPLRAEPVAGTPAAPYVAACHAGQAARALEAAYREQVAELERHGRDVLRRFSPAQLAAALYAAVYVEQIEGRLAPLDLDRVEDLSSLIQRLEHEDGQERAA